MIDAPIEKLAKSPDSSLAAAGPPSGRKVTFSVGMDTESLSATQRKKYKKWCSAESREKDSKEAELEMGSAAKSQIKNPAYEASKRKYDKRLCLQTMEAWRFFFLKFLPFPLP